MRYFIFVLLFLLGFPLLYAQENLFFKFEETPLKEVILQLEKEMGLSFSYAEDLIDNKTITALAEGLSMNELLGLLEAQTGLHFEKIDGQAQIIIAPISLEKEVCIYLLDQDTRTPITETQLW